MQPLSNRRKHSPTILNWILSVQECNHILCNFSRLSLFIQQKQNVPEIHPSCAYQEFSPLHGWKYSVEWVCHDSTIYILRDILIVCIFGVFCFPSLIYVSLFSSFCLPVSYLSICACVVGFMHARQALYHWTVSTVMLEHFFRIPFWFINRILSASLCGVSFCGFSCFTCIIYS
jgi:hypothetical protein